MKKISEFLSVNFQFLVVKFSIYLNRHVFVMSFTICHSKDVLADQGTSLSGNKNIAFCGICHGIAKSLIRLCGFASIYHRSLLSTYISFKTLP